MIVSLLLVQEAIAEEQQRQQPQASIGAHYQRHCCLTEASVITGLVSTAAVIAGSRQEVARAHAQ